MAKKRKRSRELTAEDQARLERIKYVGADPATVLTVMEGIKAELQLREANAAQRTLRWVMATEAFDAAVLRSDDPVEWIEAARRAAIAG